MAFNQLTVRKYASTAVSLNTVVTGSVTSAATLVIAVSSPGTNIEWDSLVANVSAAITTTSLAVVTRWEVSNDNTTWVPLYGLNAPANVGVAPAGTGSPVTTAYAQAAPVNPSYPYMRLAVVSTGATGGAADIVTISYNYRKRWLGA